MSNNVRPSLPQPEPEPEPKEEEEEKHISEYQTEKEEVEDVGEIKTDENVYKKEQEEEEEDL